jgi:hypothetical protein
MAFLTLANSGVSPRANLAAASMIGTGIVSAPRAPPSRGPTYAVANWAVEFIEFWLGRNALTRYPRRTVLLEHDEGVAVVIAVRISVEQPGIQPIR